MISSIQIFDDFNKINAEYKRFNREIYQEWSESNEESLYLLENQLIESIINLLKSEQANRDENIIRALIGSRVLSKYSIMNQEKCVKFFEQIVSQLPTSIEKKLFIFKTIAKQSRREINSAWNIFINSFINTHLPMKPPEKSREFVENALMYINFLIDYAPDFTFKYSDCIFTNLIFIISGNTYKLESNYDNQINNFEPDHLANKGIEVLRIILLKFQTIRYGAISIQEFKKWQPINALATLSVFLETCKSKFLKEEENLINIFDFSKNLISNKNKEIQCLATRNIIYCLMLGKNISQDDISKLLSHILSFENISNESEIICAKLQNLYILFKGNQPDLISKLIPNLDKIIEIINQFINNQDINIKNTTIDLLNAFLYFWFKPEISNLSTFKEKFSQINIDQCYFKYDILTKLIFDCDQEKFIKNLISCLSKDQNSNHSDRALEALQFLNPIKTNSQDEYDYDAPTGSTEGEKCINHILEFISNENKKLLSECILKLYDDSDSQIRSLVPVVLAKINPNQLFEKKTLDDFMTLLLVDKSEEVQLAILQSFNNHLTSENYKEFNNETIHYISNGLLINYVPQSIRIEVIKLLCKLTKFQNFDFSSELKPYIDFFDRFSQYPINSNQQYAGIVPQNLAYNSQYLIYIFEAYPDLVITHFQSFFNFALDFMNFVTMNNNKNDKDNNNNNYYINRTRLQMNVSSRTFFQGKFYEITYCSFMDTIKYIIENNPDIFNGYSNDIFSFCINKLYYGITELETESTLNIVEFILNKIGLEKAIELNKDILFDGTNLYKIIFETGSHFMSPKIKKHIFEILGFIGAQLLYQAPIPLYIDSNAHNKLKYEIWNMSDIKTQTMIYYSTCSKLLFQILEDHSMFDNHFLALNSLIYLQNTLSSIANNYTRNDFNQFTRFKNDFKLCFFYFKRMLDNNHDTKEQFVDLLEKIVSNRYEFISDFVPSMVETLIFLWEQGGSRILYAFTKSLKTNFSPYLNQMIALIRTLDDTSEIIKMLSDIYVKCIKENSNNDLFYINIIGILIDISDQHNVEAVNCLDELVPHIKNLETCGRDLLNMCLMNINEAAANNNNSSNDDDDFMRNIFSLLDSLILRYNSNQDFKSIMDEYSADLRVALNNFPNELRKFNDALQQQQQQQVPKQRKKKISPSSKPTDDFYYSKVVRESTDGDCQQFAQIFIDFNRNEINPLYIQQWVNNLIRFTIERSPSLLIMLASGVAKKYPIYGLSVFNIAFYSFCYEISKKKEEDNQNNGAPPKSSSPPPPSPSPDQPNQPDQPENPFKKLKKEISNAFIKLLINKNISPYCHLVLSKLIEFMDRAGIPLFDPEDFDDYPAITTIFSSAPTLALRYSLLHFDRTNRDFTEKDKQISDEEKRKQRANLAKIAAEQKVENATANDREKAEAELAKVDKRIKEIGTIIKNLESEKEKLKLKRDNALIDLEKAYMNVGSLDQYHQFTRLFSPESENDHSNKIIPIYSNNIERINFIKTANKLFNEGNWDDFDSHIRQSDQKSIFHLFKTTELIRKHWESNSNNDNNNNNQIYKDITNEIEKGFIALSHEEGTYFSHGIASSLQSLVYSEQLTELRELYKNNGKVNNFLLRFKNSSQISNFLHPVLLLRIAAKGNQRDSLIEKVFLLSVCRESNKWESMKNYYDYFAEIKTPISRISAEARRFRDSLEVQYEMMYYKIANDRVNESEFSILQTKMQNNNNNDNNNLVLYDNNKIFDKLVKYQKAMYYSHYYDNTLKLKEVTELCNNFDDADAINLWSSAYLKLFDRFILDESKAALIKEYLEKAIKGYIKGSLKSDKMRVSNMLLIISLLNNHYSGNGRLIQFSFKQIPFRKELENLPLHFYLEVVSHIIVPQINDTSFRQYIVNLLIELMKMYPHGVIYDYMFSHFSDIRTEKNKIISPLIDDVKCYFFKNPNILSNQNDNIIDIFNQAEALTKNLYHLSSDILAVSLDFLEHIYDFVSTEISSSHKKREIDILINHSINFYLEKYLEPLIKWIEKHPNDQNNNNNSNNYQKDDQNDNDYEPTNNEKEYLKSQSLADLTDKNKLYTSITNIREILIELSKNKKKYRKIRQKDMQIAVNSHKKDIYDSFTKKTNELVGITNAKPAIHRFKSHDPNEVTSTNKTKSKRKKGVKSTGIPSTKRSILFGKKTDSDSDRDYDYENEELQELNPTPENKASFTQATIKPQKSNPKRKPPPSGVVTRNDIMNNLNCDDDDDDDDDYDDNDDDDDSIHNQEEEKSNKNNDNTNDKQKVKISITDETDRYEFFDQIMSNKKANTITANDILNQINENKKKLGKELRNITDLIIKLKEKIKDINSNSKGRFLFKDEPNMAEMSNMCLPVFGTYRHDQPPILISKFDKKYDIITSKIRPRKLKIIGSDGNKYIFFLKASEDLRTDQRQMILFHLLNKFLKTKIRTYTVTPLTSRFGIIQFVNNSISLKDLIKGSRKRQGIDKTNVELDFINAHLNVPQDVNETTYYDNLPNIQRMELFQLLLSATKERQYDLRDALWCFASTSEQWVRYTTNFTRTCATTSIVGYIIGLGDRHCSNIMICQDDGVIVHIDFGDCYEVCQQRFNSPERVPFRLTRNLVNAFGPCGTRGTFQITCEDTMSLIRENREIIYNVLKVFAKSPTQTNGRAKDLVRSVVEVRQQNKENHYRIKRITQKLNGTDRSIYYDEENKNRNNNDYANPMTVHEHVLKLIDYATSDYYLALSYHGWDPWL